MESNQFNAYSITVDGLRIYGSGTANWRNTRRNISRRSPSTNMGYYPAVELGCKLMESNKLIKNFVYAKIFVRGILQGNFTREFYKYTGNLDQIEAGKTTA